jgi:MFS family permease
MLSKEAQDLLSEIKDKTEGKTKHWHALAAAWLGEAFDAMDASIFFIAMVPAMTELLRSQSSIEIGQIGSVILAIFMLGWFFGAIGFGVLADRIGRRKTMILTILIYSAATGLCALCNNWMQLAACRFIVGCGIGGEICLGTVIIAEFWKGRPRLWATALLESSFNAGLMFAAMFNSLLGPLGWRWLFVAGIIPALMTLYVRSKITESQSFETVKSNREGARRKNINELTNHEKSLLRSPIVELITGETKGRLLVTAILGASAVVGYWACVAWIPAWVNQLTGTAAINERSIATTVFSVGGLAGCFLTPPLLDRIGRKNTALLSFGGGFLATALMFLTVHSYGPHLFAFCLAVGIMTNIQFTLLQIYIPEAFGTQILGTATGIIFGAGRIFAVLLALCGGQLIATFDGSYALASATLSLAYAVGFIASFRLYATNGEVAGITEIPAVSRQRIPVLSSSNT